jgi:predicted DNA-binding transcriptional regulator AlpA
MPPSTTIQPGYLPLADAAALAGLERELADATPEQLTRLIGQLEYLKAKALARLMKPAGVPERGPSPPENGHYLTVKEVAATFHVTPKWLYRHKEKLPHSQPTRKVLLFPEAAIRKWFASRIAPS